MLDICHKSNHEMWKLRSFPWKRRKKYFFFIYMLITVRLVSPDNSPSFGRVEVQFNRTWGTICGNNWDLKDADAVCRQLGYDGALSALRDAAFGQGTGPIWLNRVQCGGSEKSVSQCAHAGWGGHSCGHHNDASVVCHQIKGNSIMYALLSQ